MSKDREEFDQRCAELRDAKAAVDVFQRSSIKGAMQTVTIHVHTDDDTECLTRFDVPVGAINSFLGTAVKGVDLVEKFAKMIDALEAGAAQDTEGRLPIGGYRGGELA